MYSKKLQRNIKRHFTEPDIHNKTRALTHKLDDPSALDMQEREILSVLVSNLPDFLTSIDQSYEQYEDQHKMTMRNLQLSSQELNEVNDNLERLHAALRAMLDGLGQGLLFFNHEGICSSIFSTSCEKLLESSPGELHFADVLRLENKEREVFERCMRMLFLGRTALSFQELVELAPAAYAHSKGYKIELSYRPLYDKQHTLKYVLVIATDRTAEYETQIELDRREKAALRTLRIARNRNMFIRMVAQMRELLHMWEDYINNPQSFLNYVHTMKSTVGLFQLPELAASLHGLESLLQTGTTRAELMQKKEAIERDFDHALEEASVILGDDFEQKGHISAITTNELAIFQQALHEKFEHQAQGIYRLFLDHVIARPIHSQLEDFDVQLRDIAERFGKEVRCRYEGENFPVLHSCYSGLFDALVHIARNIVDHGIEEPQLRIQMGKDSFATVRISTRRMDDERFELIIADDGGGIDIRRCRMRLSEKMGRSEVDAMSEEEVIQHIFSPDFSTRDEVTEMSGRGVGMSAVREETQKLGGNVHVETKAGEYTRFIFQLPFRWEDN